MCYNNYSKGEIQMKPTKTIEQLEEMLRNDGYEEPKTIGETEGMLGEIL